MIDAADGAVLEGGWDTLGSIGLSRSVLHEFDVSYSVLSVFKSTPSCSLDISASAIHFAAHFRR